MRRVRVGASDGFAAALMNAVRSDGSSSFAHVYLPWVTPVNALRDWAMAAQFQGHFSCISQLEHYYEAGRSCLSYLGR